MNMPKRETYGAQPPIELLRQYLDHGGWYDRRNLQFVEIVDSSFIGAMGPPGGGRNPVTARFLRHFNQIAHTDLEPSSLNTIFDTIVSNSLDKFSGDVRALASPVVQATIDVYQRVSAGLLPTPSKSHYTFNLRDLSGAFQGMLSASSRRITTVPAFMRLWIHECRRVFCDRLIDDHDRQWFDTLLADTLRRHFDIDFAEIMPAHMLLFGDYMVRQQQRKDGAVQGGAASHRSGSSLLKSLTFFLFLFLFSFHCVCTCHHIVSRPLGRDGL